MTIYELRQVATPDDGREMHRLRRDVLFAPFRKQGIVYDENHPDDRHPCHCCSVLAAGRPASPVSTSRAVSPSSASSPSRPTCSGKAMAAR